MPFLAAGRLCEMGRRCDGLANGKSISKTKLVMWCCRVGTEMPHGDVATVPDFLACANFYCFFALEQPTERQLTIRYL